MKDYIFVTGASGIGKTAEEVLQQAIEIIDIRESVLDYEYEKPPKELFCSWVFANGLR